MKYGLYKYPHSSPMCALVFLILSLCHPTVLAWRHFSNLFCLLKALHPLPLKSQCCCKETKTKLPLSVHNHVINHFGWSTCEVWQTKLPRYTHHVQVQARWVTLDDLPLLRVFPIGKRMFQDNTEFLLKLTLFDCKSQLA